MSSVNGSSPVSPLDYASASKPNFNAKTGTIFVNGKTYHVKVMVGGNWKEAKLGVGVKAGQLNPAQVNGAIKGLLANAGIKKDAKFSKLTFCGDGKYAIDGETKKVGGAKIAQQLENIKTVYAQFQCSLDGSEFGLLEAIKKEKKKKEEEDDGEGVGEDNGSASVASSEGVESVEEDDDDDDDESVGNEGDGSQVGRSEKGDNDDDKSVDSSSSDDDDDDDDQSLSSIGDEIEDGAVMLTEVKEKPVAQKSIWERIFG